MYLHIAVLNIMTLVRGRPYMHTVINRGKPVREQLCVPGDATTFRRIFTCDNMPLSQADTLSPPCNEGDRLGQSAKERTFNKAVYRTAEPACPSETHWHPFLDTKPGRQ